MRRLEGGCQAPVGARAVAARDRIALSGMVADRSGRRIFRGDISGARADAAVLGTRLAERLIEEGAGAVLEESRS